MQVWANPGSRQELLLPGEQSIAEWRSKSMNDRWRDYTRLAWEISPALSVFLPVRLKNSDIIIKEICGLVQIQPVYVMHISEALQYLVTTETLLNDASKVNNIVSYFNKKLTFLKKNKKNYNLIIIIINCIINPIINLL